MIYNAIGIMSGSSLDGLDIAYVQFQEVAGKWNFEIVSATCLPYSNDWIEKLSKAPNLPAREYLLLHSAYGHYIGEQVNQFISANQLEHKVHLVGSHGHTSFHMPGNRMTAQLGDGAAIAAATGLPVVSDLRALDVAFGGHGAPIVPIGEKLLFAEYDFLLNLGGIANLSMKIKDEYIAFDVCPANRVLNMIAAETGKAFDENGKMASGGSSSGSLLKMLNDLPYYAQPYPKSLANDFGTDEVYPLVKSHHLYVPDALHTYVDHITTQVKIAIEKLRQQFNVTDEQRLMVTGGGALNGYLTQCIKQALLEVKVDVVIPDQSIVEFKEAVIMSLIGILRWREEYNVLASVTGAKRNSIGGALWLGTEA